MDKKELAILLAFLRSIIEVGADKLAPLIGNIPEAERLATGNKTMAFLVIDFILDELKRGCIQGP